MHQTRAFCTLDCAQKVRVRYVLPRTVDRDFLTLLPEAEVVLNEFSRFVEGAQDHFSISLPGRLHLSGSLESEHLTVTFGRWDGERPDAEIALFEQLLFEAGFGECVHADSAS